MLAVQRFVLSGIGPPGARFDPLQVDLTDLKHGTRAARTAVMFLENGGGKTVLLRLLFAVVLPGRRSTVGSVKLDGYVGSGDTGHVALEWRTPDGGQLVTGLVLEWRNRTRSGSSANLLPLWYSFAPRDGLLDLDRLPLREGDRRVTRAGFRERLMDLSRDHPELQLVVEDSPAKWGEHLLRATPIDPAAFRYQRQMNADEADAESLFTGLRTDDDFVRFVVEAIHDPDEIEDFGALVNEYAGQLGRRLALETERRFCRAAADALLPLAGAGTRRRAARRAQSSAREAATRLRYRVESAARTAQTASEQARQSGQTAAGEASELDRRAKRVSEIASELRRIEAELRLAEVRSAQKAASRHAAEARQVIAAWEAVGLLVEITGLEAELSALIESQELATSELEPLRRAAEQAEGQLVSCLVSDADRLDALADDATNRAEAAGSRSHELLLRARQDRSETDRAVARSVVLRERAEEVARHRTAAAAAGELRPGEEPAAAAIRTGREADEGAARYSSCKNQRRQAEREARDLASRQLVAGGDVQRLSGELDTVRRGQNEAKALGRSLVETPRAQQICPGAEDAWVVLETLHDSLRAAVGQATTELRSLDADVTEIEVSLGAIGTDGLRPPSADVRRVWSAIVDAGIAASSGWSWLAHNLDEPSRARALLVNPGIAGGIVVTDPARLDEARAAVADAGIETDAVVLLGAAQDLDRAAPGLAAPVRPALYDPAWTERERTRLEADRVVLTARHDELVAFLGIDEPLLDRVRHLQREHSPARMVALAAREESLEERLRQANELLKTLGAQSDRLEAMRAELELGEAALSGVAELARDKARAMASLADEVANATAWVAAADTLATRGAECLGSAEQAEREADMLKAEGESARLSAAAARRDAGSYRSEAAALGVEAVPPPESLPVEDLRGAARAARQIYEAKRAGRDLTDRLEMIEGRLGERRSERSALPVEEQRQASALQAKPGAADPTVRRRYLAEQRVVESVAQNELLRRTEECGAAERELKDRTPNDRPRHTVLAAHETPADAEQAAAWSVRRQREFLDLSEQQRQREALASQHLADADRLDVNNRLLRAAVSGLPVYDGDEDLGSWDRSADEAQEDADAARVALAVADEGAVSADVAFEAAGHSVRVIATDREATGLGGVRVALAEESLESLADRAEVLAGELETMVASVDAELADVLRHREGILARLATITETFLGHLRRISRLSTLPEGLGEWSRRPFLSVEFSSPEPGQLTGRLADVLDEAAANPSRWPPLSLLMGALRAAVVQRVGDGQRTFRVRMLRPNRMMQLQWAGMAELEREFSGGMKLTAAICTYCTLAALRAQTRSTGTLIGLEPGPLFLDNPLGKASADYLLELQHAIALRLGVQLVHTTGVWDVEALASYERVVRLRNLADLRSGVQRLTVDGPGSVVPVTDSGVDAVSLTVRASQ